MSVTGNAIFDSEEIPYSSFRRLSAHVGIWKDLPSTSSSCSSFAGHMDAPCGAVAFHGQGMAEHDVEISPMNS